MSADYQLDTGRSDNILRIETNDDFSDNVSGIWNVLVNQDQNRIEDLLNELNVSRKSSKIFDTNTSFLKAQ